MKITIVLPPVNLSGGIRIIKDYAERLQRRGHEVILVSVPKTSLTLTQKIKFIFKNPKEYFSNKFTKHSSHLYETNVPHYVINHKPPVINEDVPDADVVIATWWETAEWVANLLPSKGIKFYFIQHHELHDYLPKERVRETYFLPLHKITISKWLVNVLQIQYSAHNISLVPNSVDTQQFNALPRNKQKIPTVGVMYSTKSWKGCDISLQAFALAAQKMPNLRLIAFGIKTPSSELPLPHNTKYIRQPSQDSIKNIYSQCDAWLFGSRIEGFGLPILEAMACRTPVIATPAGAAPELLSSGGGILVKPEDPEDMARAIEQILQLSNKQWQNMSEAAYNKAVSYTWDDATDLFENALYKAIKYSKIERQTS